MVAIRDRQASCSSHTRYSLALEFVRLGYLDATRQHLPFASLERRQQVEIIRYYSTVSEVKSSEDDAQSGGVMEACWEIAELCENDPEIRQHMSE